MRILALGMLAALAGTAADAQERARKEKKLVLLFQLVGELDLEGC